MACCVQRYAEVRLVLRTASQSARFMRMTKLVASDASIVYQDIDLAELRDAALKVALICSSSPTSSVKAAAFPPAAVISAASA